MFGPDVEEGQRLRREGRRSLDRSSTGRVNVRPDGLNYPSFTDWIVLALSLRTKCDTNSCEWRGSRGC